MKDPGDPARRRVLFRSSKQPAIAPDASNDPRVGGATLEVIGSGAGDGSTGALGLPEEFWTALGNPPGSKGFKFLDRSSTQGVSKVLFKPGANGGRLLIRGGGEAWPYEITQPQGEITVRFTSGEDTFCSTFEEFLRNEPGSVLARDAAPPIACGSPSCGDGLADGVEECDDGNTLSGDGCSSLCALENVSAICAGIPTVSGTSITTVRIATGLEFPVHVAAPPLDPNRLFVVEQQGRIRIIKSGALLAAPFLAIEGKVACCGERGLLSVAFHPDFETNGRFFVNYTNNDGDTVIARYQVSGGNPDDADEGSEIILLTVDQPFSNHNGGQLAFGPDGFLYAGMGDGGSGGDPQENGQSDTTLLGKMLRINVDVDSPPFYAVPTSNPNPGAGDPLGLIRAKGLRNPWRFTFDRLTGDVYIGDVGQAAVEEVDFQPSASTGGENYGWDVFEGSDCFDPQPHLTTCPDPPTEFTMPVAEYGHGANGGCSVTGGFVYRGCRMPDLRGTYFYSDYCSAFIRTFRMVGGAATNQADVTQQLAPGGGLSIDSVTSFGEDTRGELYIADHGGEIFKIVPGE
jgi:cysteine-rich repeat protein